MSHQCIADAFTPVEARYKVAVMKHVWGHLAPAKNKSYCGFIIFANSAYDGPVLIDSDFRGLEDSPWLWGAMMDFVHDYLTGCIVRDEFGRVYRFSGVFKNYEFKGSVAQCL